MKLPAARSQEFYTQNTRLRKKFLDFHRGIPVGNLDDDERITRILKVALERRFSQSFVTERRAWWSNLTFKVGKPVLQGRQSRKQRYTCKDYEEIDGLIVDC